MDPTPQNLLPLFTSVNVTFYEGYAGTAPWVDEVAMTVPSDTSLELYGWMDRMNTMREWIGPRVVASPIVQSRSLVNKHWEATYGMDLNRVRDDKYGLLLPEIRELARQVAKQHDYQMQSTIESNPTCFDGTPFFGTAHPTDTSGQLNSTTQSNDLTTLALSPSAWGTVKSAMRSFVGRDGKPFNEWPDLLVVPTALEEAALTLRDAAFFSPQSFGGSTTNVGNVQNIYKGTMRVLVIPELTHPKIWYALSTQSAVKAFIKQLRMEAQFVPRVSPTDDNVFWMRQLIWGADMRSAYDVSLWFKAIRCGAGL
jgi:phage major head subunit gpT-like protein